MRPTFRPYSEDNLTPLTLREVLRDEYLRGAIMWLLGYDASRPLSQQLDNRPMRAQAIGSTWQVAWTSLDCLYARAIFVKDQVHADLVREIDRQLLGDDHLQGVAEWLLKRRHASKDEFVNWNGRLFDTAITLNTLIRLRSQYPAQLHSDEMSLTVKKGLRWLVECVALRNGPDWSHNDALAQVIMMFVCAARLWEEQFRAIQEEYAQKVSSDPDPLLSVVKTVLSRGENIGGGQRSGPGLWYESPPYGQETCTRDWNVIGEGVDVEYVDEAGAVKMRHWDSYPMVLRSLAQVSRDSGLGDQETESILLNLQGGLLYLEQRLRQGFEAHGPRSNALTAYIEGHEVLGQDLAGQHQWDDNLILSILHRNCRHGSRFEDGSIFLDLYTTKYFADCLAQAVERWPRAQEQVVRLYDDALEVVTKEGRMTAERRQIYELNLVEHELRTKLRIAERDRVEAERKHKSLGKRHTRLWSASFSLFLVFVAIILAVILVLPYFGIGGLQLDPTRGGDLFSLISTAAVLVAGLYALIAIVIFRQSE